MNDIGFTIPAQGATYWAGEAVQTIDFKELEQVPDAVASTNAGLACNAAHLSWILRNQQCGVSVFPSSMPRNEDWKTGAGEACYEARCRNRRTGDWIQEVPAGQTPPGPCQADES